MATDLCPWLGTAQDGELRYAEPSTAHVCYARKRKAKLPAEHQARFCLTAEHPACSFYRKPPAPAQSPGPFGSEGVQDEVGPPPRRFPLVSAGLWLIVIAAAVIVLYQYTAAQRMSGLTPTPIVRPAGSPQAALAAAPAGTSGRAAGTPSPTFQFLEPTATSTAYPDGAIYNLLPAVDMGGWVASDETSGNHLGDSYLYSGVFDGVVYHGVFQFDLSAVPRGAAIHSAVLELTGLDARRLGVGGAWEVRILDVEADTQWAAKTYQAVHNAPVQWTLAPVLGVGEVAPGRVNAFELPKQVADGLEQRLLDEHYAVSFRIDGPLAGSNCVFAWDTGSGVATLGRPPRLVLSVGAAPRTPVPSGTPQAVVVTSTPTPVNVVTAAVWARTATASVLEKGQPTSTSLWEVTATAEQVVTAAPTPANDATAQWNARIATAVAFTTGTFTPTPPYLRTATPTPLMIPLEELTPTPTSPPPTPTRPLPEGLRGKLLYWSDRTGEPAPWVMDPDGQGIALLTADWPYEVAARREQISPDGKLEVYTGLFLGKSTVLVRSVAGGLSTPLVVFQQGQVSSPVWSPSGNLIAFVGSGSAIGTHIWLANADGTGLRQLTSSRSSAGGGRSGESHPTFSADGAELAYAGSDAQGRRQIWIMDVDGSDRRNVGDNVWDEWDPVWVK